MTFNESYLTYHWPDKPENVQLVTTLKKGGMSTGEFAQFNLATHVGDNEQAVLTNRKKLRDDLKLALEPVWLNQTHSNKVVILKKNNLPKTLVTADASVTRDKNLACVVLTADCLPIFFCNRAGTEVAVVHAGWRGLLNGIIRQTFQLMLSTESEVLVNFGPAIGPNVFEVGAEVRRAFVQKNPINHHAFKLIKEKSAKKKYYLSNIYQLAYNELNSIGIKQINLTNYCSYTEQSSFYSYRKQAVTGRMANLIWIK